MKKVNIKIAILALATGLGVVSCQKRLDIPSRNAIDASLALSNKNGVNAAINSVYSVLKSERLYGRDMLSVAEAMADVAFANGRSSRLLGENRNQSGAAMNNWGTAYGAVNEINLILQAMPDIADGPAPASWEGELRFLRALYFFDLVKNYSYIP